MKRWLLVLVTVLFATQAYAHGPEKGPNGGPQVDAGDYHVEMVAAARALDVYVTNDKMEAIDAKGFSGVGILIVSGKPQRIELKFDAANKLKGVSPVALASPVKGVIQITPPGGKTVQAKFE